MIENFLNNTLDKIPIGFIFIALVVFLFFANQASLSHSKVMKQVEREHGYRHPGAGISYFLDFVFTLFLIIFAIAGVLTIVNNPSYLTTIK